MMNNPESDCIEQCALQDLHAAALTTDREESGLSTITVNKVLVSTASSLPSSAIVINRSLGLNPDISKDDVDTVFGATVPEYRCSGSQTALMQARLCRALD